MNIETIENQLIDASMAIGRIAETNCHYTAGLARRIQETGKPVPELTIAELIQLDKEYSAFFNQACR